MSLAAHADSQGSQGSNRPTWLGMMIPEGSSRQAQGRLLRCRLRRGPWDTISLSCMGQGDRKRFMQGPSQQAGSAFQSGVRQYRLLHIVSNMRRQHGSCRGCPFHLSRAAGAGAVCLAVMLLLSDRSAHLLPSVLVNVQLTGAFHPATTCAAAGARGVEGAMGLCGCSVRSSLSPGIMSGIS